MFIAGRGFRGADGFPLRSTGLRFPDLGGQLNEGIWAMAYGTRQT